MNARRFVDTNILLYAVSTTVEECSKAETALRLLESDDLVLSVQVLQEFYVQATRPAKPDRISHEQASALIESWLRFPVQETTVALMQAAMQTRQKYGLSYWDASIIAAARMLDCRVVISEDLSHGADYSGITVLNPFRNEE